MLVSELIREIRIKCQLSQRELAEMSEILPISISKYARDKSHPGLLPLHRLIVIANDKAGMCVKETDIEKVA